MIAFSATQLSASAQTRLVKNENGYYLSYNGSPYFVKGVGGEVQLDLAVSIGANSIRTWGVENAQQILDQAQAKGLTVMLGLWLQHERHGFDYNDSSKVKRQLEYFKTIIDKYKNHPALLLWGVGNELDLNYSNTNVWYAVQDLAKYIHETDPNHPTSTVTAGLDSNEVQLISHRCPDIDIYCVNTYGDIASVPQHIAAYGWTGPYMITEWGPNGYWESPQTSWKVSIEQTSTEKKRVYYDRYRQFIEPNTSHCIGSYAFLWGAKQEYTETWFGLFSKNNEPTEPIDALETVFSGHYPKMGAPTINQLTLNNQPNSSNISLKAGQRYGASVSAGISLNMSTQIPDTSGALKYEWKVLAESDDKKSGGDKEEDASEIRVSITDKHLPNITLRTPENAGAYRLFVKITGNGKVAYANVPFLVEERTAVDGPAHFVQFKRQSMDFSK